MRWIAGDKFHEDSNFYRDKRYEWSRKNDDEKIRETASSFTTSEEDERVHMMMVGF